MADSCKPSPQLTPCSRDDERFMQMALAEARQAFEAGEVPVGAVVVTHSTVVGRGHNLTETLGDVTAHAEMQAITAAAQTLGGKYLTDCTLYVTVEPCVMCGGAITWSQMGRVVYGTSDPKRGYSQAVGSETYHKRTAVTSGVLEAECSALMKEFFARRR